MLRYHKDLYFPDKDKIKLTVEKLNTKRWGYTAHSFEKIKLRANLESILEFVRDIQFKAEDVFEYYKYNDIIEKLCFRIGYDESNDIIIVVNQYKGLVTIYFNYKVQNHATLNPKHYCLK